MPKSVTFTLPPGVSSTLLGFTSRCTTPWWCACARASAICAPMAATSAGGSVPRASSSARRLSTLDELHDDEGLGAAAPVVDTHHVGVVQARRGPGFALEPLRGGRGDGGRRHLDRHRTLEQTVAGAVDVAHPARAEPHLELVAVGEEFRDRRHAANLPSTAARIPSGRSCRRENRVDQSGMLSYRHQAHDAARTRGDRTCPRAGDSRPSRSTRARHPTRRRAPAPSRSTRPRATCSATPRTRRRCSGSRSSATSTRGS